MDICNINDCTGCFTCMNICAKGAISAGTDRMGKTIPIIDKDKCVGCGLCAERCPQNHPSEKNYPKKCYALWTKNNKDREISSSGGAAAGFSRYIINSGGAVFGASFDGELEPVHKCAETQEEALEFRGSKYVQSFTGYTYREAKRILEEGRYVLYTGTPCQIDGLRKYLNKDYDRLITVDIVCHGTPPAKYLREYAQAVCKEKADKATFRGVYDFNLVFYNSGRVLYKKERYEDYYFTAFLHALTYRDNCYTCGYARSDRCSDITIGDFWGIDRSTLHKKYNGRISMAFINTDKGAQFFGNVKNEFVCEERQIDEALNGNGNLRFPSRRHKERDVFENKYLKSGFYKAVKTDSIRRIILKTKIRKKFLFKVLKKIKMFIKG